MKLYFSDVDMVGVGSSSLPGRTRLELPKLVRQNCREQFWTPIGRARRAEYPDDTSSPLGRTKQTGLA